VAPPSSNFGILDGVTDYFVKYQSNNVIGTIDYAYHVQAARPENANPRTKESAIFSPVCLALAKAFGEAVDAPKTGKYPELHSKWIQCSTVPDFMAYDGNFQLKTQKRVFEAQTAVGELFRAAKAAFEQFGHLYDNLDLSKCELDADLLVTGHEEFEGIALGHWKDYRKKCTTMIRSDTDNEMEEDKKRRRPYTTIKTAGKTFESIRSESREAFDKAVEGDELVRNKLASAYYAVTYAKGGDSRRSYAFPWLVVGDVLLELKGTARRGDSSRPYVVSADMLRKLLS